MQNFILNHTLHLNRKSYNDRNYSSAGVEQSFRIDLLRYRLVVVAVATDTILPSFKTVLFIYSSQPQY